MCAENDLSLHLDKIYDVDETDVKINNKPGKVISSNVNGKNVTVISYCSAQGNFRPPILIYKGTYSKPKFVGLPPWSQVCMNEKSPYINTDLLRNIPAV